MNIKKYLVAAILLTVVPAGAVSWLSGIVYDQNDDTISLNTTGDTPAGVGIAASDDDVAALVLYDTRISPDKYTMAPDDGVVHRIVAEEVKVSGKWQVRVKVEMGGAFPFEVEHTEFDDNRSTVKITLSGVNVERRPVDTVGRVPAWARPSKDSKVADYLEYGEKPVLLDYERGFYLVRLEDGYTGWVEEKYVKLPDGMENPFYAGLKDVSELRKQIITDARKYIGTPYVWGGTSSSGFDCSGFVQTIFAGNGITLPRGSGDQFREGGKISKKEMKPGDLIFFHTYTSGPSHVGIWLGDGRFIHAESSPAGVTITPLSVPYWDERYHGSRRWINGE